MRRLEDYERVGHLDGARQLGSTRPGPTARALCEREATARARAHYPDEFPGSQRFLGLGQLPPEALRLLWSTRKPVTPAQLALGNAAWDAPHRQTTRGTSPRSPAPARRRYPLWRRRCIGICANCRRWKTG